MRGGLWQLGQSIIRRLNQSDKHAITTRYFSSGCDLKKTVLHDFHVANGGKMAPFAGWSMPVQYKDSITASAVNCRENGSLFDVSHMRGMSLRGKDCIPFLENLVVADVAGLGPGTGMMTVFTDEKGGVIDDAVISKVTDEHLYLVGNAGCRGDDLAHIEERMKGFKAKGGDVSWHVHDERSILALQGPLAAPTLQRLTKDDLSKIYFGDFKILDINGVCCFLTRTGHTGEDGFEISVPSEDATDLAKSLLERSGGKIRLTGLGARDILKLEAGLCLYFAFDQLPCLNGNARHAGGGRARMGHREAKESRRRVFRRGCDPQTTGGRPCHQARRPDVLRTASEDPQRDSGRRGLCRWRGHQRRVQPLPEEEHCHGIC